MDIVGPDSCLELKVCRSAGKVGTYVQVSAPAHVTIGKQARQLAQRSFRPLSMERERDKFQLRGAAEGPINANDPSVGKGEVKIGSCGLRFKTQSPLVWLINPDRYIRVKKREGLLLVSLLEVDAGGGGFDVGEA